MSRLSLRLGARLSAQSAKMWELRLISDISLWHILLCLMPLR
ncbi:hypothetical protein IMCC12053_1110 [Celeribacter marinus]|uniref:Uncharacterized protein n=1 Tax=Celeribacter marinus TaxID=1397108 RepID=A0A0P0A945_9RHOB|nr:hypothetical protein IMCC12053_1110 [Celeribacter marinus]